MRIPLGVGKVSGFSTSRGLNQTTLSGIPDGAKMAVIRTETQNIRWRDDGTDPTATTGMLMLTTDPPLEYMGDLTKFQFIPATAGAVVHVAFYGLG